MSQGTPKTLNQAIVNGAHLAGMEIPLQGTVSIERTVEDFIRQKMTVVTLKYHDRATASAVNELIEMLFFKNPET